MVGDNHQVTYGELGVHSTRGITYEQGTYA